jgi:putative transposase
VAVLITGANRHDGTKLAALRDATVVEPSPPAPPHLAVDRGYADQTCRDEAIARGSTVHIPPKASADRPVPPPGHPARHPPRRWVGEVGHAWFHRCRRVLIRWEKLGAHYLGFVQLAACLIIYRKIRHARALSG